MANRILYLKVDWMEFYDGRKGDKARGNYKHVKEFGDAHEDHNFELQPDGYFYAYAPIKGGRGAPQISRLGAPAGSSFINDVNVVFISYDKARKGVFVVGWYKNARVYRKLQELGGKREYLARCKKRGVLRLELDDRSLRITSPPRRSGVWYGRPDVDAKVRRLLNGEYAASGPRRTSHDAEECLKVELAAYEAVTKKYSAMGYQIDPIWKRQKCGWDLEATCNKHRLYIEVKGVSGNDVSAELTPNEFAKSQEQSGYRICIVTAALKKPCVHTFSANAAGVWYDETGKCKLTFERRTGARLSTIPVK